MSAHEVVRDHLRATFICLILQPANVGKSKRSVCDRHLLNVREFVKYSSDSASLNFGSSQNPFPELFQNIVLLAMLGYLRTT
jgi:hypothetical protein